MATLESLEQRLAALEREVAQLKAGLRPDRSPPQPGAESEGARLIREAADGHADFLAGWGQLMEELGVRGQPIGAPKLRELLRQKGIRPEDNLFSRGIIAMREE
jgi:hypothetical protein